MKKLVIFSLISLTLCIFGCTQTEISSNTSETPSSTASNVNLTIDHKMAREFSDKVVNALIENRQKELYQMGEQVMSNAISENEFNGYLEKMFSTYGQPLKAEFKSDSSGYRIYADSKRKPVRKFWYSVQTTKNEEGQYLFTEIVPDGDSLAFVAFAIVTFPKGVPPELK